MHGAVDTPKEAESRCNEGVISTGRVFASSLCVAAKSIDICIPTYNIHIFHGVWILDLLRHKALGVDTSFFNLTHSLCSVYAP